MENQNFFQNHPFLAAVLIVLGIFAALAFISLSALFYFVAVVHRC